MKNYFLALENINKRDYFLVYVLFNALFLYVSYGIIADPIAYVGDSQKTIKFYGIFTTIMYFLSPFYEYLKIYILARIIQKGLDSTLKIKSDFKLIFLLILTAQFSMLLADMVKVLWLLFVQKDLQMHDRKHFVPLSLFNLFERENLKPTYFYSLKLANVFEFMYWTILSVGIAHLFNTTKKIGFKIVFKTYGAVIFIILIIKTIFNSLFFGF